LYGRRQVYSHAPKEKFNAINVHDASEVIEFLAHSVDNWQIQKVQKLFLGHLNSRSSTNYRFNLKYQDNLRK